MKTADISQPIFLWAPDTVTTAEQRDQWAASEEGRRAAVAALPDDHRRTKVLSCVLEHAGLNRAHNRHYASFRASVRIRVPDAETGEHPVIRAGRLD